MHCDQFSGIPVTNGTLVLSFIPYHSLVGLGHPFVLKQTKFLSTESWWILTSEKANNYFIVSVEHVASEGLIAAALECGH